MVTRKMGIIALLFCFCLSLMPPYAQAASTADAKEPIVTDRECTLSVCYGYEDTVFSGQTVQLYQVADVSSGGQYTLTNAFAASELILNGIQTNGEWNVIRSTLETHIVADYIAPTQTVTTDTNGQAQFARLNPGLYLVSAVEVAQDDLSCSFDSTLVALPGLDTDGLWQYEVTVSAKPQVLPPVQPDETLQFTVLKLWKGDENHSDRPTSIEVEIFRDGISVETVVLSSDNQWSYSWTAKDDGASWKVIERNVPTGYTMTVEQRESTFLLTNTKVPENPDQPTPKPPSTGDTANIMFYTILLYASGTMLLLMGIAGKRKRHEETN